LDRILRVYFVVFVLLWTLTLSIAAGQPAADVTAPAADATPPAADATPPAAAASAAALDVSAEQIQTKIEQITNDKDLPESERSTITDVYQTALDQLQQAGRYADDAAGFAQALTEAPAETTRLRQRLQAAAVPIEIQVTADTTLQELENKLTTEQAQLANLQQRLDQLNQQLVANQARPDKLRSELSEAQAALLEVERELAALPAAGAEAPLVGAQQLALNTRRLLLRNQVDMLEQELQSYDVRLELLKARVADVTRQADISETRLAQLQENVNARRRHEAAQTIRQSEATARQTSIQSNIAQDAAASNRDLSQQLAALVDRIEQATQRNIRLNEQLKELQES
jgi:potassium efflux system protein